MAGWLGGIVRIRTAEEPVLALFVEHDEIYALQAKIGAGDTLKKDSSVHPT